jgi:deoxycitidine kinase/deoxyguanosine kinase
MDVLLPPAASAGHPSSLLSRLSETSFASVYHKYCLDSSKNPTARNKLKIVSLEGNIGAGKSTLLEQLKSKCAANPKWVFLREPVDLWDQIKDANGETMLSKFYADPKKYAFGFQIMAYATRLHLIRKLIQENPDCELVICERSLDADKHIFAKMLHDDGLIEDVMYQIYERFFGEYEESFKLDAVVYVDSDAEVCFDRIGVRARDGETCDGKATIALDYLKKCREYHQRWLVDNPELPVLRLNTNEDATFDPEDLEDAGRKWLNQIMGFLDNMVSREELVIGV